MQCCIPTVNVIAGVVPLRTTAPPAANLPSVHATTTSLLQALLHLLLPRLEAPSPPLVTACAVPKMATANVRAVSAAHNMDTVEMAAPSFGTCAGGSTGTPAAQDATVPVTSSGGGNFDFSGRATYYNTRAFGAGGQTTTGIGACGGQLWDSDYAVALNSPQYSQGGWCGQQICIQADGAAVTATVLDLCPECPWGALDLTPAAYQAVSGGSLGMIPSVRWRRGAC
ncbi:hypothetical protein HDU93_005556 [Gonapodya sp. JEL0774]|nr:hypothetical protein HDU93_005556 [Gonapodya sp. JEL0774]